MPDNRKRPVSSIIVAIVLGLLYWILDGCLIAVLNEDVHFIDAIFAPEPAWTYRRLMVLGLLIIAAIYFRVRVLKRLDETDKRKRPPKPRQPTNDKRL